MCAPKRYIGSLIESEEWMGMDMLDARMESVNEEDKVRGSSVVLFVTLARRT